MAPGAASFLAHLGALQETDEALAVLQRSDAASPSSGSGGGEEVAAAPADEPSRGGEGQPDTSTEGREGESSEGVPEVAATSCQVCGSDRPPLWAIRAKRVVHDSEERQIYFDNAQLQVLGVPVFYIPRLRLPDPTLDRARGFLIPELKTSTLLLSSVRTT